MPLFFNDRIPDPIHGENTRYYDAISNDGTVKLPDFKLVLKNNIPADKLGDPLSAGNINYASGNIMLPAASPEETHRGDILTLTPHGVIPTRTNRNIAAKGLSYDTAPFNYGFLKLSDTKLLLLYSDRMTVATVNFSDKSISFGEYKNYFNNSNNNKIHGNGVILRNYDENPTALFFTVTQDTNDPYACTPALYTITGDIISNPSYFSNFPATHTQMTNPVRTGNASVLICSANASGNNCYATLLNCANGIPVLTTQVQIPGVTNAILRQTLFGYDRINGKYILIYASSSNIYTVTITISINGSNILFGAPQLLGTASEVLFPLVHTNQQILSDQTYMPAGSDYFSDCDGKIILVSNSDGGYGPAKYQILNADSTGAVTKGAIKNLPVNNITNYLGSSCLALNKDGRIYLTGVDREVTPRDSCMLEIITEGLNSEIKKYRPFRLFGGTDDVFTMNYFKSAAYENPDNPGEFLFMQNGAYSDSLTFWFGRAADCVKPDNIIGVAIDEPVNNHVRVQTAGKYLPELYNNFNNLNNLKTGQFYTSGDNGAIVPFTGAAGTKPLGIATSQSDLQFFGSMIL